MSSDRLAPLDLAFWHLESAGHPMHLGALAFFSPGEGAPATPATGPELLELIAGRAAAIPRLRARVRDVLLPVGGAAWAPDPDFDVRHHVRHVPLAGTDFTARAVALAGHLMERPLERSRPLWETHLLTQGGDGPADGSFAVLAKFHHALADGMRATALGAGLLDGTAPAGPRPRTDPPAPPDPLTAPLRLAGRARDHAAALGRAALVGTAVLRAGRLGPPAHRALTAAPSGTRRIATAVLDLEDVRRVRKAAGGTANDILLTVVAGALRRWARERGEPLPAAGDPRALVPVSRHRPGDPPGSGNSLSGYLLELPTGEDDPGARLAAVRRTMDRNRAAGPLRGAGAVALLADRIPPLAHRYGTPFAGAAARLLFDVLVTTVPLPRGTLSLGGHPLTALHPLAPLARGQSLAVAMTPYDGQVYAGLVADGEAVPDLDRLAWSLGEELVELLDRTLA
ncbi:wax ester/triacylglycerol synthase family O-acyltransferase [Streptomyces yaizuensis]|uniref:Diacylglycerol O-acyltransferase n=1 Tax=Streptomyces yaizuensis TaxID=2989713 RepID=A0ABQ5NQY8_9ACTN|nr:wax ester/triacylglycerol synthase family O-acyltransferase [Streptomyces sp. YSPA8]GLF92776.1 wax ester/triacylglycerol synthase family O-acyltransferase [Streptomyces sp. YSPA8]